MRRDVRAVAGNVAVPAGLAAATFLAAQPCLRAYNVPGAPGVLVAAAVVSTVIGFGTPRWWRQPPFVSYGVSLIGLVALLLIACGLHPSQILDQLGRGPSHLVSETLPLTGGRVLLSALVVLTWVAGATASELMGRFGPSRPLASVALVIPVALFALCYGAGTAAPGDDQIAGPLLLLTLALLAVARRVEADAIAEIASGPLTDSAESPPRRGRAAVAGALAAGAATLAMALAVPAVPAISRHPATVHRAAPTAVSRVIDPLAAMANLRDRDPKGPPQVVASVTTDAPSSGYLAMGVLDDYDGATWRFNVTFQPTGGRIASAPGSAADVELQAVVQQHVEIRSQLPIPLLPGLDRPEEISGLPVLADSKTGMLLPAETTGLSGLAYSVLSRTPRVILSMIPPADGIDTGAGANDLSLPPDSTAATTTALRYLATITGERPAPNVAFLQAAAAAVQARDRRINPALVSSQTSAAPTTSTTLRNNRTHPGTPPTTTPPITGYGGTSLSDVVNAVTVSHAATPEQFATFLAMGARALGIPARVVTGLRIGSSSSGGLIPAGTYQITNRQAWAWVEIPVSGVGWVVADPTPDATSGVHPQAPEAAQASASTLPSRQANAVPRSEIAGGHPLAKPSAVHLPRSHAVAVWILALVSFGGLVLLAVVAGPGQAGLRRWLRRRARRAGDPGELAVGAWLQIIDGLFQAGMNAPSGATSSEIAADAGSHFGADLAGPVEEVGSLADRALCSSRRIEKEEAERAWGLQRDVGKAVHDGLDRRQRARALLTVGPAPRRPAGSDRR